MAVSVQNISTLERRLTSHVSNQEITTECEKQLKELQTKVNLKGFRPGKVPPRVVQEKFGQDVRQRVMLDLIQKDLTQALEEVKLDPVSQPTLDLKETSADKPEVTYEVSFEVAPEIDLTALKKIEIEQPTCTVTDADINKVLEELRKQHATWKEVKRAGKEGDQITLDFKGTIDGEAFSGGEAEDFEFVLGAKSMLADFEAGVANTKAGDEKTVTVDFPAEYGAKELAGKKAEFAIKIKKVEEPILPELNAELAEKLGVKEGGIDALRQQVKERLETEVDNVTQTQTFEHLHDALVKTFDIELPKSMLAEHARHIQHELEEQLKKYGADRKLLEHDTLQSSVDERAKRQVKLILVTQAFIKAENISLDEDRVRQKLEKLAAGYEEPSHVIKWYHSQENLMNNLKNQTLEEQIYTEMLTKVKTKDKAYSYEDLLNPKQEEKKKKKGKSTGGDKAKDDATDPSS